MTTAIKNLWDDTVAAGLSEPELLLYRSNLLGADLRVTNFGGGNTSAKITDADPLTGEAVEVLWVKGSGGDLGSIRLDGFSTLYLDKLHALEGLYRGLDHEDEMVGYLPHCTFALNPRAASIDTPLHSFIPHAHVDHMHPDAVIALACTARSEELTTQVFGGRIGWLPWQRPGFDLGLKLGQIAQENPVLEGVVLAGHGLFTWGDTSKACYEKTIEIINLASDWLAHENAGPAFGGAWFDQPLDEQQRRAVAARIMPMLRGRITGDQMKIGHFNDGPEILEFVNSNRLEELAALGTSCPDHFLRTKIRPLVIDFDPLASDLQAEIDRVLAGLDAALAAYRADYAAYYERCKRANSPAMRDPNAIVYLIPGVGMVTFAKDKATARIAGEFYINAINVMREADGVDTYVGLDEQEAFDIEYWLLEEAKLQRMPRPKELAGHIAFVTGGAGGIGTATARRLLAEGACVMLADIDEDALQATSTALAEEFSRDVVAQTYCDVTDEASVKAAFAATCAAFGGVDILVSNAGIASSSPLDETSMDVWRKNIDILVTGYFLVGREAFSVLKTQDIGGSIVFVASKNALVASANAAAYCTAKGAELQLARSIALEGAPLGIRCNTVNPDAVLRGSKIWTGKWREERAAAYDMQTDELEEHYRTRSLLKRSVFPEDIAEAIYFFASSLSSKSTGNILNVDAGHAPSFTR
jgi:rhamnulose-1-phosphate aldolase/alcohol dehydrogenase